MDTINNNVLSSLNGNNIIYPNKLVEIAMVQFVPKEIILSAREYNTIDKIKDFIIDYINEELIPSIQKDSNIYKPEKSYIRLNDSELNEKCFEVFSNDLKKYIWQRILIY